MKNDHYRRHCWHESCSNIIQLLHILASVKNEPMVKKMPTLAYCSMTMSNSCFEYWQVFTVPSKSILVAWPLAGKKSKWTVDIWNILGQLVLSALLLKTGIKLGLNLLGYLGKKALAKSAVLRVSFNSLLRPLISSSKFQFILKPLCTLYSSGRDLSNGAKYYVVNMVVCLEF